MYRTANKNFLLNTWVSDITHWYTATLSGYVQHRKLTFFNLQILHIIRELPNYNYKVHLMCTMFIWGNLIFIVYYMVEILVLDVPIWVRPTPVRPTPVDLNINNMQIFSNLWKLEISYIVEYLFESTSITIMFGSL